jgi:hypothetical protein
MTHGMDVPHHAARDANYLALRRSLRLDLTILWDVDPALPANMSDIAKNTFHTSRFNIECAYNRGVCETATKKLSMKRDYDEALARRTKERKRFHEKQQECAALFREIFGPAAIVHIEGLMTNFEFVQAWETLLAIYDTVPDENFKSDLIMKINAQRFNGRQTLSGWIQGMEEMWAPFEELNLEYTDGEKISAIRNGILKGESPHKSRLSGPLNYARDQGMNYEHTKALVATCQLSRR